MNKYEEIYKRAAKRGDTHWRDSAIAALAFDLEAATGWPVTVGGPFGLRAEVMIEVGKSYLLITPEFPDGNLRLFYDTGKAINDYPAESLGYWNNMHHVREPLPDSVDEILKLLQQ